MQGLYEEMLFNNYEEFYIKRHLLKYNYSFLNYEERRKYKVFIYSLTMKEYFKDKIWEYFNEPMISPYYVYEKELRKIFEIYEKNKNSIEI